MNHPYIPITKEEEREMLHECGVASFSELISIIPEKFILKDDLDIGKSLSEFEIEKELDKIINNNATNNICFMGRGIYDHYVPKIVDFLSSRSEFYTAYTPYQAEVSQGTLQYLYEYQSMICELTDMDISNASLYDGASAIAEACMIATSYTGRNCILYSSAINERHIDVLKNLLSGKDFILKRIPSKDGITDFNEINNIDDVACIICQSPNKNGLIEDMEKVGDITKNNKTLFISTGDPFSLSILSTPGSYGADIFVGEGQVFGNYMNYGGPLLGIIAIKDKYKRKLPGRVVGKTLDKEGNVGYVLTLQTREQHIRKERATSNICTNQGLLALRACIYLSLLGKNGLPYIANISFQKAQYTATEICKLSNYQLKYKNNNFIKEFLIKTNHNYKDLRNHCLKEKILIDTFQNRLKENIIQIAVTEKRSKEDIDKLIHTLKIFN